MKYVKILGLLAVAAAALMAFAGTASADYLTETTGGETPPVNTVKIHAENEGGHVILKNPIFNIECASTATGVVEKHNGGPTGTSATGALSELFFTSCTNSWHVTTKVLGALYVDWTTGHNGTVFSENTTVEATRFLVPCYYKTNNTHIGTLTGGKPATLDVNASIPIEPTSSELCGSGNAEWKGLYVTTNALYVVNS